MTSQTQPRRTGPVPAAGTADGSASGPHAPRRLGRIVTGSVVAGVFVALGLATAPVVPPQEEAVTGAVLVGFATGWGSIAWLSSRLTSSPQRWAAIPAGFMGIGGLLLLLLGSSARPGVDWAWPPLALLLAGWAVPRVHRLPSRTGRRLLAGVLGLLAITSIGAGYQTLGSAFDARHRSMPGQLLDVGGHRLHLNCTGTGSPTVVLEPGAGEMAANLAWITPAVSRTTRTCVYDRPGRGWSDPAEPRSGAQLAEELHVLLDRAGVPGPYVLAGHSFGGLYVLAYAARYPDDVSGMVLIDSTSPAATSGPASDTRPGAVAERVAALLSATARLGLSRLYAGFAFEDLPPRARTCVRASVATPATVRSTIDEYLMGAASMRDAAALHDLGDKPLVVLTAPVGAAAGWSVRQDRLATLSRNTTHRVIDGASHEDLVAAVKYADVTARAITDVVASVRAGQ